MAPIPIDQQPVEIALGCILLNSRSFQGWSFLRSLGVLPVTVSAVIYEDTSTSRHGVCLIVIWICPLAIAGRHFRQPRAVRYHCREHTQRRQNQEQSGGEEGCSSLQFPPR